MAFISGVRGSYRRVLGKQVALPDIYLSILTLGMQWRKGCQVPGGGREVSWSQETDRCEKAGALPRGWQWVW